VFVRIVSWLHLKQGVKPSQLMCGNRARSCTPIAGRRSHWAMGEESPLSPPNVGLNFSERRLDELIEKRCKSLQADNGCMLSGASRDRPVIVGWSTANRPSSVTPSMIIALLRPNPAKTPALTSARLANHHRILPCPPRSSSASHASCMIALALVNLSPFCLSRH
jgi:hypothetical protein